MTDPVTRPNTQPVEPTSVPRKNFVRRFFSALGPGLVTGAADDDPSGVATYSVAGAQLGTSLLWTAALTWPLMATVQMMCARIGMVTGQGLAGAMRKKLPKQLLVVFSVLLLVANTINIASDLSGMADAAEMLTGWNSHWFVVPFGVGIAWATVRLRYYQIAMVLKWLALSLFAYVVTTFLVGPNWREVAGAAFVPSVPSGREWWGALVAILGTTISPYLFFWQASHEVEQEKAQGRRTLAQRRGAAAHELADARLDVFTGMFFSNVAMFFIMLATAATLHPAGRTEIETARQAAEALRPLAGDLAYGLFALGIIGTGLLAVPVLAGSASFAVAEVFGWRSGLDLSPRRGRRFYLVFAGAVVAGMLLDLAGTNPMRMLFLCAVLNGLLAPPLLLLVMLVGRNRAIMGEHANGPWLSVLGWTATAVMSLAAVAFFATAW